MMGSSGIRPDWFAKTLAGLLLGFTFALGCCALFLLLTPGMAIGAKVQLAMWLFMPVWLTVLSLIYLFENGKRAWLWMIALNLLLLAVWAVVRLY